MKINGSFVIRDIAGECIVIPVGETALHFGGMIVLNSVSRVIWECLQSDVQIDDIVNSIVQRFDIGREDAKADTLEFLEQMKAENLITD